MLNGDVLTDIDLTAQIAQHEATGATGDAGARSGRGPEPPTGSCAATPTTRCVEFLEKPSGDQELDTNLISAGAYVLERSVLDLIPPDAQRLDRARGLAAAGRRRALRLRRPRALLAGHRDARALPAGHVRHPRGQRPHGGRRAPRRRLRRGGRRRVGGGARGPAGGRRARLLDRRRRARRQPRRARRGRVGRRRGEHRALGRARRRRDRRRLHSCATASSRPARAIGDGRVVSGGAVLGEGVTIGADNVLTRGIRVFPGDRARRRRDHVLTARCATMGAMSTTESLTLDREAIAAGRHVRADRRTSSRSPSTCATRCGRWSRPTCEPWDSPGGLVVAGMGGSAIGGALARAVLGDHASRPILVVARLRPAAVDDARHDRAVRELLGRHRGDARLLTRRPARSARQRVVVTTGGAARRAGARRRRAGDPGRRRASAARRGRLHDRRRARGRRAAAAPAPRMNAEIDVAADHLEQLRRRVGARRAPRTRQAKALARALHGTIPVIVGAGLTDADRLPLEDPDQRERQAARVRPRAAGARPQRDRRLGRRARPRALRAVFLEDSDTHPRVRAARRADRAPDRRPGAVGTHRVDVARHDVRSSASSRSCCSATSSRSTWPSCAASTRRRSRSIDELKASLAAED